MQIRALREYAARRGWAITLQAKEVGSGASQRQLREKLLQAAGRREIDFVLVWRLDRWGRSVTDLLSTLQELEAGLVAVFAAFEREILQERVRAGLAHARQSGKRLGRPPNATFKAGQVLKLYRAGISKAEIARRLEIGRTSVRRILSDLFPGKWGYPISTQPCRRLTVDAAMPNFLVQEICGGVRPSATDRIWEEWLGFPAMRMVNGRFPLPEKPGLGFDLTEAALAKYPFAGTRPMARVFAPDGSVVEW